MTEESVDCFPRVEMFRVRGLAGNVVLVATLRSLFRTYGPLMQTSGLPTRTQQCNSFAPYETVDCSFLTYLD